MSSHYSDASEAEEKQRLIHLDEKRKELRAQLDQLVEMKYKTEWEIEKIVKKLHEIGW